MTKSIASYPEQQREGVIRRRIQGSNRGAGYHAALSAANKLGISVSTGKFVSKKKWDETQKQAGKEFAKKMVDRKKQLRRRPAFQNKMRIKRG